MADGDGEDTAMAEADPAPDPDPEAAATAAASRSAWGGGSDSPADETPWRGQDAQWPDVDAGESWKRVPEQATASAGYDNPPYEDVAIQSRAPADVALGAGAGSEQWTGVGSGLV
jgi:hypothetical protein